MKILLFNLILILSVNITFGQNEIDTVFYNSKWEVTTKTDFTYYGVLTKNSEGEYLSKDYWKIGEINMTGKYSSLSPEVREGVFKWYYENGKIRQVINYSSNNIVGEVQHFDKDGILDQKFIVDINSLDNALAFNKAIMKLTKHIQKKIEYPEKLVKDKVEGRVITRFIINPHGIVTKFSILSSISKELDDEAKRVIMTFKKWPSPIYNNESTSLEIRIPINFTL